MGAMLLLAMENVNAGSERPEVDGRSLSPLSGNNQDPTPSGSSSPMISVSNQMQFRNRTLRPSGEAAVTGSESG